MDASLTLLSVVQPILATAAAAAGIDGGMDAPLAAQSVNPEGEEERVALESVALERTAARIRLLDLSVDTRVVVDARPAHAIVDYASRHRIELIAMTTHGRGGLKRLVAGSVSESVLQAADAHMLLYRPEHPAPS
jgi:nucleotide-binding universal stress UspA family protein